MMRNISKRLLTLMMMTAFMVCLAIPVQAKVPLGLANKLKNGELTPVGANPSGNKEGTIPPWDGGLSEIPKNVNFNPESEDQLPDPYADDRILFTITAQNVDQYADKLSPGVIQMFKRYPDTWKMHVYPTRRSAAYAKRHYEGTFRNALSAELIKGGDDGVTNFGLGFPFPIPLNGAEAIHNHLYRLSGVPTRVEPSASYLVSPKGYTISGEVNIELFEFPEKMSVEEINATGFFMGQLMSYDEPPGQKGEIIVGKNPTNYALNDSAAWIYMPGQRRVRRAPNYAYDGAVALYAGLGVSDDAYMYSGRIDRYDWKLKGKKEMYVLYNCYGMDLPADKDTVLTPYHINPKYFRWELHRVWEVEATLREGERHIYSKRVFYLDEDSWIVLAKDQYDNHGDLWRMGLNFTKQRYHYPAYNISSFCFWDFQTDKYVAIGLKIGYPRARVVDIPADHFTVQYLRQLGNR